MSCRIIIKQLYHDNTLRVRSTALQSNNNNCNTYFKWDDKREQLQTVFKNVLKKEGTVRDIGDKSGNKKLVLKD